MLAGRSAREAAASLSPAELTGVARVVVDSVRRAIMAQGEPVDVTHIDWDRRMKEGVRERLARRLQRVVNATGVILHTNLGRAPLSDKALNAVVETAKGYSNLEYDVVRGGRGSRHDHGEALLVQLSGAEAAMVVNNNAAAILLVLSALAAGKEVILSRGEMIEIGGAFRIPDVLAQSGCRLVEVGTTNRTHLRDYEGALTPETAAFLKVHTSNYKVSGFTSSVSTRELAPVAERRGVHLIEDLGSGVFVRTETFGLVHEPTVQEAVAAGADVVTFSGDKLLGGPQVGVIVGRRALIERCQKHPLARAVRVDKMALAALQATLMEYACGTPEQVPIWRMMAVTPAELRERARAIADAIAAGLAPPDGTGRAHVAVRVEERRSAIGGGSLPEETLPTWGVVVRFTEGSGSVVRLADSLRRLSPPIVARVEDDALVFDPRTLLPGDDALLAASVVQLLGRGA